MDHEAKRETAQSNWDAYQRGIDAGHGAYVEVARKCDEYYRGEQWSDADKAKLAAEGRPALTINAIKTAVNAVLGEYSELRVDFVFKPRGNAMHDTATALTKQMLQIQDNNDYADVEAMVFADGLIQDRGYFDVRLDFDDNLNGEIRITHEDPIDIIPDPTAKDYDPKTWNEVIKTRWLTLEQITLYYGKGKSDELRATVGTTAESFGQDSIRFNQQTFGDVDIYEMTGDWEGQELRRVRVIERQYYKLRQAKFFIDPDTGDMREISEAWDDEKIAEFAERVGLFVHRKLARTVRWSITADHVVLHDEWSPYKSFTIVPFFPYYRRGRPTGMVRDLLSPQEQLNKVESQQLHIVNTTANSGWMIEAGSLVNMTDDELEERGAETGLVLVYGKGRNAPAKIQPNQVPTGLDRFGAKALSHIREISGVAAMLGVESAEVSGVALNAKQARGQVQMAVPFDSLRKSRMMIAKKCLELIQNFYTETRVLRTTNNASLFQDETDETTVNEQTPEGTILNDLSLGEYDVVISTAPARDTFAETQFAEALNLRNAGVNVPDHWVIMYSNLNDKVQVAQEAQQAAGLAPPSEEEQQMQEFQMAMQIQSAQLELEKMSAEIQELQSVAQLNQAKAAVAVGDAQLEAQLAQQKAQTDMAKLQASYVQTMAKLQNNLQLATLHTDAKTRDSTMATASKRFAESQKSQEGIAKALLSHDAAMNKPQSAAKPAAK
jgi:hypothetical protein